MIVNVLTHNVSILACTTTRAHLGRNVWYKTTWPYANANQGSWVILT